MGLYSKPGGEVMQSRSPLFSDFADLMADAFSAAQAAGEEARTAARAQALRMAGELDLVSRDEFDAVKAELDAARARIDALESKIADLGGKSAAKPAPAKRAARKKASD